jgi:5-methylcytosine-specific restriction endonuclease McrA
VKISSAILRQLAALRLSSEQFKGVVEIICQLAEAEAARRARDANRQREARRLGRRLSPDQWESIRARVFLRDGFACAYCGDRLHKRDLTIDHIVPVSRGGGHELDNLCVACKPCNSSKADRLLSEWGGGK